MNQTLIYLVSIAFVCVVIVILVIRPELRRRDPNFGKALAQTYVLPLIAGLVVMLFFYIHQLYNWMSLPAGLIAIFLAEAAIAYRLFLRRRLKDVSPDSRPPFTAFAQIAITVAYATFFIGGLLAVSIVSNNGFDRLHYGLLELPLVQYLLIYLVTAAVSFADNDSAFVPEDNA